MSKYTVFELLCHHGWKDLKANNTDNRNLMWSYDMTESFRVKCRV